VWTSLAPTLIVEGQPSYAHRKARTAGYNENPVSAGTPGTIAPPTDGRLRRAFLAIRGFARKFLDGFGHLRVTADLSFLPRGGDGSEKMPENVSLVAAGALTVRATPPRPPV
jgi:hypothetical protein